MNPDPQPRFNRLDDWLRWQEGLHAQEIDLGLERVADVLGRLCWKTPGPVVTVGGTNGKGSSIALLEAIFSAAGYHCGAYTSPHLLRYNERIRIDRQPVSDDQLCRAFERVDRARGDTSLTYFEFGTLAALEIFAQAEPDVLLLEVGLGGRLDAVNVVDPDIALITTVAIDHTDWLGADRESIGREKAGILRRKQVAVCGDLDPPHSVLARAAELGTQLLRAGRDFSWENNGSCWRWRDQASFLDDLSAPSLSGEVQMANAAAALAVVRALADRLPVDESALRIGIADARLPARFQRVAADPEIVLDVAHNPQASTALAAMLEARPSAGRTHAIFGIMADKDLPAVIAPMLAVVDDWWLVQPDLPRAAPVGSVSPVLEAAGAVVRTVPTDCVTVLAQVVEQCDPEDRVVVFGSFNTVAEVAGRLAID